MPTAAERLPKLSDHVRLLKLGLPLRQFRPPASLDRPSDSPPDGLFLANQYNQLSAPGNASSEEVPSQHHVVLLHHRNDHG